VIKDNNRIEDLRNIYGELNENRKAKIEKMAIRLLDIQMIVEKEKNIPEENMINHRD
jgi:hypothetical protein